MAQPGTARFGAFLVSLGNGDSPLTYTAPCGFTSKALNLTKNLQEITIPDCDDPDAPFWQGRDVQSLSFAVTGDGVLAEESVDTWLDAFYSTESVPVQIEIEFPSGTRTFNGLAHLEGFNVAVELGGRVTAQVSMQGDGELTRSIVT